MPGDVTTALAAAQRNDPEAAAKLLPFVYDELRRLAARYLGGNGAADTLQPTALVHEAYLRLVRSDARNYQSRTHFFATAAGAMRHVLVDHVRKQCAAKRGNGQRPLTIIESDGVRSDDATPYELLALNELLERLASLSPRAARVVDLRVFGGLTTADIAAVINVSERTVKEDWRIGRAWLRAELKRDLTDDT